MSMFFLVSFYIQKKLKVILNLIVTSRKKYYYKNHHYKHSVTPTANMKVQWPTELFLHNFGDFLGVNNSCQRSFTE